MKKKIAFISEHASPLAILGGADSGGQNIYVDQVARNLATLGYEVDIYTRWDDPTRDQITKYLPGVRVIHVEAGPRQVLPKEQLFGYMDEFAANMEAFIVEEGLHYQVVHAHFWMSGYVAMQLRKSLGIPYVVTFHALGKIRRIHQGTADGFPDCRFSVEETVARKADLVIAECPQDKEDLMILYYVPEEKIKVIPCGFDGTEFYPIDRRRARLKLGLHPDEPVILQLGRMVPRKGVENVVRSLALVNGRREQPARLLIVGGETDDPDPLKTPEIARLQAVASEHNLLSQISFVGRKQRGHLKYFYNAADIFVSTPWYEPFGITPLEAMACGTPVVGSNVGGIKFSVKHGKTGYLVPPNEPEILSERLLEILDNPALSRTFSLNAIKHVNSMFTWDKVAAGIAKVYDRVGAKKVRATRHIQLPMFDLPSPYVQTEYNLGLSQ
ncbi:MAG: glycosyltransferase family 1 protein [Cytophagales bacterium]|nr:glycosyltransferase family 1 protein [Cytophagales bacterium]